MNSPWQINILTLFPELFPGPLSKSVTGRGLEQNLWSINTYNIRDYANNKHRTVDDIPYGGGSGMLIRADVLSNAIKATFDSKRIIYLSPRGKLFNQELARDLAKEPGINLICGRFERQTNVLDSFEVNKRKISSLKDKKILLIDDVITTGLVYCGYSKRFLYSGELPKLSSCNESWQCKILGIFLRHASIRI